MKIIKSNELEKALSLNYRQYLTGHLQKPQPYLQNFDDDIEIGISYYHEFTADTPHMHPVCTEHCYVLEGSVKIRLLDESQQEVELNKGDFFLLRPGIPYASKNSQNTRVLFIKSPSMNDKTNVPISEELQKWLSSWD